MIQVTAAVEDDRVDALGLGARGDELTDCTGGSLVAAVALDRLVQGGSGDQRVAGDIVDDLGVNVLFRTENVQAGSLGSAGDFGANALMTLDALCFGIGSFNLIGTPPYFLAPVLPTLRRMTSSAYLMPLPLYGSGGRFSRISAAN